MTTQSTGSLKGRIAGILIVLIALPVLALAPAYLASRFMMQSPSLDIEQISFQPSAADLSDEKSIQSSITTVDEEPILPDEGFAIIVDSVTSDDPAFGDFSGEVVFLDTLSDDDCIFTLRFFESSNGEAETFTGHIKIADEVRSDDRNCGIFFKDDWEAQ
ncbi:MAG: hypothetical protein F4Y63_09460 [Chloroflexi bacterium]|nr:hypothetical protein [Chloroflexota bacterium]MYK60888.1 hypothetical protein [Chloroflexota bacterium]